MTLHIRNGFLVEVFGGGRAPRRARIVAAQPEEGRIRHNGTTRAGGRRYALAFHFAPGINQGRAVAWPIGD